MYVQQRHWARLSAKWHAHYLYVIAECLEQDHIRCISSLIRQVAQRRHRREDWRQLGHPVQAGHRELDESAMACPIQGQRVCLDRLINIGGGLSLGFHDCGLCFTCAESDSDASDASSLFVTQAYDSDSATTSEDLELTDSVLAGRHQWPTAWHLSRISCCHFGLSRWCTSSVGLVPIGTDVLVHLLAFMEGSRSDSMQLSRPPG